MRSSKPATTRANLLPQNITIKDLTTPLAKVDDEDSDIRFMSLEDLHRNLDASSVAILTKENHLSNLIIDAILKCLDDTNGDVQSQALRCIGPFGPRMPYDLLPRFIDYLTSLETPKSQDQTIAPTATRYLVISLPRPLPGVAATAAVVETFDAISRVLIPRLVGHVVIPFDTKGRKQPPVGITILAVDPKRGANMDAIDLCSETIRCFGPMFREAETSAILKKLLEIIEGEPTGVVAKKKAVSAVSLLALYMSDALLTSFVSNIIDSLRMTNLSPVKRRLLIMLVGSVARSTPQRFGQYLSKVVPFVLAALSKEEHDQLLEDRAEDEAVGAVAEEVKEAALATLEDCLVSCVNEMRSYTDEAMEASIRYLSYDPAVVVDSDDEMNEMDDDDDEFEAEEDYEQEDALSDTEDASWKIRRCAVKALIALVSTRAADLVESGLLYDRIAPFLIKRFSEREENVRLEILNTMTLVLQRTSQVTFDSGEVVIDESAIPASPTLIQSRKRRRGDSNASTNDISYTIGAASPGQSPSPIAGPKAEIGKLGPSMIQAAVKLFGQKDQATKQSVIGLLTEYAHLRHGGLSDYISQLIEPTVNMIKSNSSGKSTTTSLGNNLRIDALRFLLAICETHSSKIVAPFLGSIVPGVILPIQDKYFKIACQALEASEGVIKVLTPPRSLATDGKAGAHIKAFFDAISSKAKANDADLEVRQRAIHALGVLCVRTASMPTLLPPSDRAAAFAILEERLNNETTRLASVDAIDAIVTYADEKSSLQPDWVRKVAIELASQLRKSDIRLRNSSIVALRKIATNPVTQKSIDDATVETLAATLTSIMDSSNVGGLNAASVILARLAETAPSKVVTPALNQALCTVLTSSISGSAQEKLRRLLEVIGEQGAGKQLMQDLLQKVGVSGDSTVVGSAIGTLMVAQGPSVGVDVPDIVKELESATDDQRKCLALCILGEVALRRGSASSLEPQTFLKYFKYSSDHVPRVAAIALGRAGAGNPPLYFPVIMSSMKTADQTQPLLLHSVKEILQYTSKSKVDSAGYADAIWEDIIKISSSEDNRSVGAECIGRLLAIDPLQYIPALQNYLKGPSVSTRGLVMQALRFALGDSDPALDSGLQPVLIPMIVTMLKDADLENRRLALTTLNSALKHKGALVIRNLQQLLPFVIQAAVPDETLIREVQMGPFKHKVDDGLENRKSAYETLHAFVSNAYARMEHQELFDRIIAGFRDEYDIKALSHLMLTKVLSLDPDETGRRLDALAPSFQTILTTKLKENAVKQEVEKLQDAVKEVLRTTARLNNKFPNAASATGAGQSPVWKSYMEFIHKEYVTQLRAAEDALKSEA